MTVDQGIDVLAAARRAIEIEARALRELGERLDQAFVDATTRILEASGRVVVTGVGKSGLAARKIAATLSSTGTPALFLHPTEAAHGDVGVVIRGDVLLVVSKSGASGELDTLLPAIRDVGAGVIAVTGTPGSRLARAADVVLDASVSEEACPYDVAPTASSAAAVALGDALALALMEIRGLDSTDFARLHPAGALGRRLLWTVRDVMVTGDDVPTAAPSDALADAMAGIAHHRGTVAVVADDALVGVLTAGDLMRLAAADPEFLRRPVSAAMTTDPRVAGPDERATVARARMERHGIMALPVVEEGRLRGMVHLHDILRAGVDG
ncbi:MAG: KpsF/GutQ family sugar-phosphate isomerase [Gemmatimonadetes bacterium]|nr:KpsF/GutQ family sugar-phosphate isomerase [Gemmatimonadota bacterium]